MDRESFVKPSGDANSVETAATQYITAKITLEAVEEVAEKAKKDEDDKRRALHHSMLQLAEVVGYKKGDPPLSVKIPGQNKVIRLSTLEDRDRGYRSDTRQIIAVIENMI
jgi:hypothetical protein